MDLTKLPAVRARCSEVFRLAQEGQLDCWTMDLSRQDAIVDYIISLMHRDYGGDWSRIPPHGRWRHFLAGDKDRISPLVDRWREEGTDEKEITRRMLDLTIVSVLLDAGAGNEWRFSEEDGTRIGRSEGLAIASLAAFEAGLFSSDSHQPCRVDTEGLARITVEQIAKAMQVSSHNPMAGLEGRANLLIRLGQVLSADQTFFTSIDDMPSRPGNILDYLLRASDGKAINLEQLWDALIIGLRDIWPKTPGRDGDVWRCESLAKNEGGDALVPFHKLTQWLCYSLIEVLETVGGLKIDHKELQTGLPEYRNGGLLIDFGLLTIRKEALLASLGLLPDTPTLPPLEAGHPAIVEMRAVTVAMLDRIRNGINAKLGVELCLAQAGTWKAGREIANEKRPRGEPPLTLKADGTVF